MSYLHQLIYIPFRVLKPASKSVLWQIICDTDSAMEDNEKASSKGSSDEREFEVKDDESEVIM